MSSPYDAAPVWTTACPDWSRRIVAGESLIPCNPLFPEEAAASMEVLKSLRVTDIPGKPTIGQAARPWFLDFAATVFGAYDPNSERQLIREFLLCISKKNGKSTLAAGLMMTALIRNPRNSAEFLILAPTKEVADNSFDPASDMADCVNEERVSRGKEHLFRVYRREKRIVHLVTKAELKVIAADTDTVGGTKATGVLFDELWLFGKKPSAAKMFTEATGGLTSRPEGFVVYLTTMSDDVPAGIFKSVLNKGRDIRDGKRVNKEFLPVIYEFPPDMIADQSYRDQSKFYITNPNLGASVDVPTILSKFADAEQEGEHAVRDFSAKHLNVEIGMSMGADRWRGADYWEGATDKSLTLDALIARSDVAVVGIDNGGLDDLLGLAVLGRDRDTRKWLLWCHAWAHVGALELRQKNVPKYRDLEKVKELTVVNDLMDGVRHAVGYVDMVRDAGILAAEGGIGLDEYGAIDVAEVLREAGYEEPQMQGISQGWKLKGAIQAAEIKLANKTLLHGGQELMAYCVSNAKTVQSGNAVMVTKAAAGTAKIDPLIAALNAVVLMSKNPLAQGGVTLGSDYRMSL